MTLILNIIEAVLLVPVVGGSIFSLLCVWAVARFMRQSTPPSRFMPPVTVLKPIYGLDKGLEDNLRSLCAQDYPDYQVVMSVQRENDPALPVLRRLAAEYPDRISLVVKSSEPVVNGKVQNLVNALAAARHEILVISDSDARLRPDYLKTIVAPLESANVGYVCTLYRSVDAHNLQEKLELVGLNADFVPSLVFSAVTGAAEFCIGATVAFRKSDLIAIGGMADLGNYLVEDHELGRRLLHLGKSRVLLPHMIEIVADYPTFRSWWQHQIYWDQNTWAANPTGFVLTILTRSVPFALLFGAVRGFDEFGLNVFLGALVIRFGTAEVITHLLGDREGQRAAWLLPLRDLFALVSWYIAITRRSFVWRGLRFGLTKDGRIVPRQSGAVLPGVTL
ncbi:MAG: glycosyltransferase [Rhodospirillaceae bacterium]